MASHQLITRKQLNAREQEWFKSTKDTFERSVQQQRLRVSHEVATLGNPYLLNGVPTAWGKGPAPHNDPMAVMNPETTG